MVPATTLFGVLVALLALTGAARSLPSGSWSANAHQARHPPAPPLHAQPAMPAIQELDPVDKCLFTCDYCYKQSQVLLACANECITSAVEGSMGRAWLETCPYFAQPIYFDYQPI